MSEGYDVEQCLTNTVENDVRSHSVLHVFQGILALDVSVYPICHLLHDGFYITETNGVKRWKYKASANKTIILILKRTRKVSTNILHRGNLRLYGRHLQEANPPLVECPTHWRTGSRGPTREFWQRALLPSPPRTASCGANFLPK